MAEMLVALSIVMSDGHLYLLPQTVLIMQETKKHTHSL